jgi:hypothetical protein
MISDQFLIESTGSRQESTGKKFEKLLAEIFDLGRLKDFPIYGKV